MVKGCKTLVVRLRDTGSPLFEEVWFVLRKDREEKPPEKEELLCAANRILRENTAAAAASPRARARGLFSFLLGAAFGGAMLLPLVIWLI